jgi:hypothetical protein
LFSLQKIIVSTGVIFLSVKCFAGDPFSLMAGARQAGMAHVCVMNSDFWSSFHNQAGLACNKSISFGFNYEDRFGIKELGTRTAALTVPAGKVSLGAVYSNFGYTDFRRQMTGLACGMSLSHIISAGIQIDYFSVKTAGKYKNQMLTCEAGIIVTASENTKIGIHIFNPVPGLIRKAEMPARLSIGAGTNLSKQFFAGTETEMSAGGKPELKTGFEYAEAGNFWIRGGYSTENSSFSFGLGYHTKPAIVDFAFSTHEKLGLTSSVSVIFIINEK